MGTENDEQANDDDPRPDFRRIRTEKPAGHAHVMGNEDGKQRIQYPVNGCQAESDEHHLVGQTDTKPAIRFH